jgi:hypothetical protein
MGMKMLPFANTIVEQDLTVTREQIDQIVQEALSTEQTIDIKKVIVDDELNKTIGLIYIGGTGTENCLFGMTSKKDAMERVKAFLKGDVDNHMAIRHVMWLADVKSVDITLKNRFRGEHLGEERYQVPADTIWHYVKLEANRRQIAHYTVVEDGRRISIEM